MKRLFDAQRPPSGGIPRFPIWEVVVMAFATVAGLVSVFTPNTTTTEVALGVFSNAWGIGLGISGLICIVGLMTPAPNGLVINLFGTILMSISSSAAVVGIAVYTSRPFFVGSISLYVFTVGAIIRSIQIMHQLRVLEYNITHNSQSWPIPNYEENEKDKGDDQE